MKIYLILASGKNDPLGKNNPFKPLILSILAACAPEHEYVFKDLMDSDTDSIDYKTDFDLIAISFRVSATETAFEIADKFRSLNKTVVMGGAQSSVAPLKSKAHADTVVIGEGENLWPVLLEDFKNKALKDFYVASPQKKDFLEGYNVYYAPQLPNLNDIPKPLRHLNKKKYPFDLVFAARGCPVNCSFCSVSPIFGTKMRYKNVDTVVDEINGFGKMFFLLDDTVFGRKDSYDYYKELYKKILKLKKKRFWTGQANLDAAAHTTGQEVIALAAQTGLTYAAIGFETLNRSDMQKMATKAKMGVDNSDNHLKQISKNIRYIQDQGIAISAWFTVGLENDTFKSVQETIDYCVFHNIFPVITPIQALDGTTFQKEMKNAGKLTDAKTNVSNVNLSIITNEEHIELMRQSVIKGFSFKAMIKNTFFYFRKNLALKRGFSDLVYRTIFIYITQKRLKSVIELEIIRFNSRIKNDLQT